MAGVELKFANFCIEHQQVVDSTDLDQHVIDNPTHHYVEVMFNEDVSIPEPDSLVQKITDDHITATNNPHGINTSQIGAATTADITNIQAMISDGMAVMLAHNSDMSNPHGVTTLIIGAATPADILAHTSLLDNPHNVTAAQVLAIPSSEKGVANGVAPLGSDNKIPILYIPAISIPSVNVVADAAARIALTAQEGDEAIQLDDGSHWIMDSTSTWQPRPNGNSLNVYGSNFQKVVSNSVMTTTTDNPTGVSKLSMQTSVLPIGDYKIEVSYGWNHNDTSSDFIAFLNLDGVQLQQNHRQEPKDSSGSFSTTGSIQKFYATRVYYIDNFSGSHNLDLRFLSDDDDEEESSMWDASISIMRVA